LRKHGEIPLTQAVTIERDEGIVFLTMDALPGPSTVDVALCESLASALREIAGTTSDRAVVLRGAGSVFSAGGNLQYIEQAMVDPEALLGPLIEQFHEIVLALARLPQPVIASVHGAAAGAGFSLAMACDTVVAARSARFVVGYPKIGAPCDGGLSFQLVRRLGRQRALNAFLLAESLDAGTAHDWGIVDVLVDDTALAAQTRATALQFAAHPVQAVYEIKALLRQAADGEFEAHLQREKSAFLRCAGTAEFRKRVRDFTARSGQKQHSE
jgi:2-(1,2-epoxy-1,2-dihydrophenyl)acetyl-CoA isomerase